MSFIRKLKKSQLKRQEPEPLNESYEGRYIREMNNEIEEGFHKKGEEIGMNEMCNNVIDNIIEGKEITELFNPPSLIKKGNRSMTFKLPKVSNNASVIKEEEKKQQNNGLFSEKFIKPHKKNYKRNRQKRKENEKRREAAEIEEKEAAEKKEKEEKEKKEKEERENIRKKN